MLTQFAIAALLTCFAAGQVCEVAYRERDATTVTSRVRWGGEVIDTTATVSLCDGSVAVTVGPQHTAAVAWRRDVTTSDDGFRFRSSAQWPGGTAVAALCADVFVGAPRDCRDDTTTPRLLLLFIAFPAAVSVAFLACSAWRRNSVARQCVAPAPDSTLYSAAPAVRQRAVEMTQALEQAEQAAGQADGRRSEPRGWRRSQQGRAVVDEQSQLAAVAHVQDDGDTVYHTLLSLGSVLDRTSQFCIVQLLQLDSDPDTVYLWCRSGRVGTSGRTMLVVCDGPAEGAYEFFSLVALRRSEGWNVTEGPTRPPAGRTSLQRPRKSSVVADFTVPDTLRRGSTGSFSFSPPDADECGRSTTAPAVELASHATWTEPADGLPLPRAPTAHGVDSAVETEAMPAPSLSSARPFLGFSLLEEEGSGQLRVDALFRQAPAGQVGIRLDDVVTRIGEAPVPTLDAARVAIAGHRVGTTVEVEVERPEEGRVVYAVRVMTTDAAFLGDACFFDVYSAEEELSGRPALAASTPIPT